MSEALEQARRLDEFIKCGVGARTDHGGICHVCGKRKRCGVGGNGGLFCCADCWDVYQPYVFTNPTRHPQGDDLLKLPYQPKFVKKFK